MQKKNKTPDGSKKSGPPSPDEKKLGMKKIKKFLLANPQVENMESTVMSF